MSVTIASVSIQSDAGTVDADDQLVAYASLVNEGDQSAGVDVSFTIDGSTVGGESTQLQPGEQRWVSAPVGTLTAGGHELEVVAGVDDGMSSSQESNGLTFQVTANGGSGAGGAHHEPSRPDVEVRSFTVRPHSNVEHDDGTAWTGERIGLWASIHNGDDQPAEVSVSFQVDGGGWESQTVTVQPGADEWVQHDVDALPVGVHEFEVWASMETDQQSIVVGSDTARLTVSEGGEGWRPVDVQLALHDFRGRPMQGRAIFVRFHGQDGDVAGGAETVEGAMASNGVWTSADAMIPPRGTMTVMAVALGGADEADEPIESSVRYRLAEGQNALGFTANQAFEERTITARSMRAVREQLTAEMNAGIEIEVISIGGSLASETEESREYETSVEWKVRFGRAAFEFVADAE